MSDTVAEITHTEWMTLTAKRFHFRTSALQKVDDWFKAYEDATTGGAKANALQNLARFFKIWIELKGDDYLDSIRNR